MSKVVINETTLTNIGAAIREKTGKTNLIAPGDMPTEIRSIETGGGGDLPEEAFTVSGDCSYRFAYDGWNWFIDNYGNRITTQDISNTKHMFMMTKELESVPFKINVKQDTEVILSSMFHTCENMKQLPEIGVYKPRDMEEMFRSCHSLREIPKCYEDNIDFSFMESQTSSYIGNQSGMIGSCYSLRKAPLDLFKSGNPKAGYSYVYLYGGFNGCYSLDELVSLPLLNIAANMTSNIFSSTFNNCSRLKELTFETQEDGAPLVKRWKSQTIDLSKNLGFAFDGSEANITNFNSGITLDKRVSDDTSYAALKNDADWYTRKEEYSRYNHDSAVNTINSLPDTSAYLAEKGGTNTIKFTGDAGSLTDGGAINTLTEEEIAVAAAKGWTVSFV